MWVFAADGSKYWAPTLYYDTPKECYAKVATMKPTFDSSGNKWGFLCAQVVPPVECEGKCYE